MDHQDATQLMAVEKYLLNELTPQLREEFEEHYFECQECATDLRATTAFLDAAKREFKAASVPKPSAATSEKRPGPWLWRPAFVVSAFAASLLVIAYQNAVVYPRLNQQIARSSAAEVLPSLSLMGGNSRGSQVPAITVRPAEPFLLFMDIPTQDRFSTYICSLYSPAGKLAWQVQVSAQQAKDTISISTPAANRMDGKYSLLVQGIVGPIHPKTPVDIARYSFVVKSQK